MRYSKSFCGGNQKTNLGGREKENKRGLASLDGNGAKRIKRIQLVAYMSLTLNVLLFAFMLMLLILRGESEITEEKIEILNEIKYKKLIVETENSEKIAEVTLTDATPADGYRIRLTSKYD